MYEESDNRYPAKTPSCQRHKPLSGVPIQRPPSLVPRRALILAVRETRLRAGPKERIGRHQILKFRTKSQPKCSHR